MTAKESALIEMVIEWRHRCGGECKRTLCPLCKALYDAVDAVRSARPIETRPCVGCGVMIPRDRNASDAHARSRLCDPCWEELGKPSNLPSERVRAALKAER